MVSDYLRRPSLQALPSGQRSLMTLILRKLLASSTFAIAGALDTLARKLERQLKDDQEEQDHLKEELARDYEQLDEVADEWTDDEELPEPLSVDDITAINAEIADLRSFRDLAVSITENAKGEALLSALKVGFAKAVELGGPQKAIIFTESRRTQDYLVRLLSANGHGDHLALFNGTNADPQSRAIYATWLQANRGTDHVTGSRTADMRAALVDNFRNKASILIATEAAAEGINLQFCSMVVNYDLPWNSAVTNQPMLALIDANSFYVQAFFRETVVGNFQKGDRAVVTLMSYPDTPLEGSVDSIGWGIAQQNGSTAPTLLRWRVPRHGLPVVARLASLLQRPQRSSRASRFVSNDCRLSLRLNRAASPFFSSLLCEALHTLRPGRFSMLFGDRPETARANERCRPAIDQKNGRTRDGYQF